MALLFNNAATDRVDHGNTGTDPTTCTVYLWLYPTSFVTTRRFFNKSTQTAFNFSGAGTNRIRFTMAYATTAADAQSTDNVITLNAWNFVAASFDGTNAPKMFVGSLTTPVAEVTYTGSPTAPVGARTTDSGATVTVGGNAAASFPGRIALCHWIPGTALTLAQLQEQQFFPRPMTGSKIFTHYGFNALGTQPDWSGSGFNGTVTGSAVADHVPLGPPFGFDDGAAYYVTPSSFLAAWAARQPVVGVGVY